MENLRDFWAGLPDLSGIVIHFGVTLAILVIGWMVSNLLGRWMRHVADRSPRIDPTIVPMVRTVTVWAVRIVVLLAVLARLGVQTASLVAMLGASALAIGLALQGTLQNFAAGIMLLVLRPVRAGEFVDITGQGLGTVDEIGLFMTRLIQVDGIQVMLPNTLIWGNPIINYSRNQTRRLDMMLGVRYDDDLEAALQALQALVDHHDIVLPDPPPQVTVMEYRESTIMVNIRVWAPADKYWDLYWDLYRQAPQVLRRAGLRTPIPLREIQSQPTVADAARAAND